MCIYHIHYVHMQSNLGILVLLLYFLMMLILDFTQNVK